MNFIIANERLIYFRSQPQFKGWRISEELVSLDDKEGLFKVTIINPDGFEMAVAHASNLGDFFKKNEIILLHRRDHRLIKSKICSLCLPNDHYTFSIISFLP